VLFSGSGKVARCSFVCYVERGRVVNTLAIEELGDSENLYLRFLVLRRFPRTECICSACSMRTRTSRPITASYLASSAGDMADSVANFVIQEREL